MSLHSAMMKFVLFAFICFSSFLTVEGVILGAERTATILGAGSSSETPFVSVLRDTLTIVAVSVVGVFFTAPASFALFGHGRAWVKNVAAKAARMLILSFLVVFALFVSGEVASSINPSAEKFVLSAESVLLLIAIGAGTLGVLSLDALLIALQKTGRALGIVGNSIGRFGPLAADRRYATASVELKTTPAQQIRAKGEPEKIRAESMRFLRLVQTLLHLDGMVEFRLCFRKGRGRVLITAIGKRSREELERWLLSMAKTYLPEFKPSVLAQPITNPNLHGHSVLVTGAPEPVENSQEPMARFFLENNCEGDYRAVLQGTKHGFISRLIARRKQRKLAKASGEQTTQQNPITESQQSKSVQDYATQTEHEESVRELERHLSSSAVKTWVYVEAFGETPERAKNLANAAANVLTGTLSSHRKTSALRTRETGTSLKNLRPVGKPAILLASEVVPYVWIPQTAIGTEIMPSAEFELPPELKGEIELGTIVSQSGETVHQAKLPVDNLAKHVFITGMTGSGKTTSCFNLLLQLYRLGVPFVVIEPVKREYRTLLSVIPSLQVFTLGDERTAPFRLNIFEPPSGVKVQTHLENLEAAWNGSFVMYSPLPYVVRQVLVETYKACGWDVSTDKRGRPITLDDLEFQAEKVSRALGYERNVTMDIEAALKARIFSLTLGGKGALFNAISSTPAEEILRRPTVIELQDIPDNEEKAFVTALILMNLMEYIETKGRSKQLRHLTLVEEAHRLLPNLSTQKGDPESADPRRRMVEQFANMLAEVRAYGEGLAIVEQIPTKIIPDAIKNTATKIAHRVAAADDREVLAGAMNLTQEQTPAFVALQPGEAIISVEKHPVPIKIQVPNTIDRIGLPIGEIGGDEVKRHMTEFYLRNPLPRAPQSPLVADLLLIVESRWFKIGFQEAYVGWLATGAEEPLANLLVRSARKNSKSDEDVLPYASRILSLAAERYLLFEEEKEVFPGLFMRSAERWMRNDRGN